MTGTKIYLIRHAQSEGNVHFAQGLGHLPRTALGSDLTALGIQQAQELAQQLAAVPFSALYSSPQTRARHTAEILAEGHEVSIQLDNDLRERNRAQETDQAAQQRFAARLQVLAQEWSGETIAVVTHGFVIRSFLDFIGVKKLADMPSGSFPNASYFIWEE